MKTHTEHRVMPSQPICPDNEGDMADNIHSHQYNLRLMEIRGDTGIIYTYIFLFKELGFFYIDCFPGINLSDLIFCSDSSKKLTSPREPSPSKPEVSFGFHFQEKYYFYAVMLSVRILVTTSFWFLFQPESPKTWNLEEIRGDPNPWSPPPCRTPKSPNGYADTPKNWEDCDFKMKNTP